MLVKEEIKSPTEVEFKLFMITYGCQMNVYDSHKMVETMKAHNFSITENMAEADMVIMNTCHIREKASEKVYSELGRIRMVKNARRADGKDLIIAVAGCVGQAEGEEIFRRASFVDIVVGPQSYHTLPDLVSKVRNNQKHVINLDFPEVPKFDSLDETSITQGVSAFLSVQEGCDKFCHFCCVPYTRGPEYSRPVSEVYREAVKIASFGAVELNLLGQNVNAYHGDMGDGTSCNLAQLIDKIAKIDAIKRIRYTTSHPLDMDDELIAAHGLEPKLLPFLHLPIQSGSDHILKTMNRKHTADQYLKIIEKLRAACPDLAFSSDFIVGYPGESEADFQATIDIVNEVGYSQCYSFKYSIRPGTTAANYENQIPEEVKAERLVRLQEVINKNQRAFNDATVGREVDVLFDRSGKFEGQIMGKTPYFQSIYVENGGESSGNIARVRITESYATSVKGVIIA